MSDDISIQKTFMNLLKITMANKLQTTSNMSIQDMQNRYAQFTELSKSVLKEKIDYGTIPGIKKPTLLKSGAEKLKVFYGLSVEVERTGEVFDLDKDFYDVSYMCKVLDKEGRIMAQCEGSANVMEDKYKYNWVATNKKPSKEDVEKLKAQKLGRWSKNGNDWIWMEKQEATNRISLKNTIQKMAQKRAFVGAILIATGASEFFTQDVEDMNVGNAEVVEVIEEKKEVTAEKPAEKPRFNSPELKDLEGKKNFVASFQSSQALIDEIEKRYRINQAMKMDIADLWSNTASDAPTVETKIQEEELPF